MNILRTGRLDPGRLVGREQELREIHPIRAFAIFELLLILGCAVILAAIFLTAMPRPRARSSRLGCANNLKEIGLAFRTWSLDNADEYPMAVSVTNGGTMEIAVNGAIFPHFQVLSNELNDLRILHCPEDAERGWATNLTSDLTDSKLSYFVNLDSVNGDGASLLCGDRNLTNAMAAGSRFVDVTRTTTLGWTRGTHNRWGNILFADGHVDAFANGQAGAATWTLASGTNRLAVP